MEFNVITNQSPTETVNSIKPHVPLTHIAINEKLQSLMSMPWVCVDSCQNCGPQSATCMRVDPGGALSLPDIVHESALPRSHARVSFSQHANGVCGEAGNGVHGHGWFVISLES